MNSGSILVTSDQFTDKDCFVGHSIPNKHNTYFRNVRNSHYPKYYGDESKLEDVTNLIINQIYDEGGRFLQRKQNSDNDWVVLDSHDDSISDCIKIALRAKYHNQKSYLKKGTVATTSKHLPSSTSKKPKIETNKDDDHTLSHGHSEATSNHDSMKLLLARLSSCVDLVLAKVSVLENDNLKCVEKLSQGVEKLCQKISSLEDKVSVLESQKLCQKISSLEDKVSVLESEILIRNTKQNAQADETGEIIQLDVLLEKVRPTVDDVKMDKLDDIFKRDKADKLGEIIDLDDFSISLNDYIIESNVERERQTLFKYPFPLTFEDCAKIDANTSYIKMRVNNDTVKPVSTSELIYHDYVRNIQTFTKSSLDRIRVPKEGHSTKQYLDDVVINTWFAW